MPCDISTSSKGNLEDSLFNFYTKHLLNKIRGGYIHYSTSYHLHDLLFQQFGIQEQKQIILGVCVWVGGWEGEAEVGVSTTTKDEQCTKQQKQEEKWMLLHRWRFLIFHRD